MTKPTQALETLSSDPFLLSHNGFFEQMFVGINSCQGDAL